MQLKIPPCKIMPGIYFVLCNLYPDSQIIITSSIIKRFEQLGDQQVITQSHKSNLNLMKQKILS